MRRCCVTRWSNKKVETAVRGHDSLGTGGTSCREIESTFYTIRQFDAKMTKKLHAIVILPYNRSELAVPNKSLTQTNDLKVEDILDDFFKTYGL